MARITHVKKAQQRYATVPVLNEDGTPKQTPVMRNGAQRTTKRGKPVFMAVTERDLSQPKPNLRCDYPGCTVDGGEILPGTPYKHITPKSSHYGGRQRSRHEQHPSWQVWEYSSSLSARIAQIQNDWDTSSCDSPDDVTGLLEEIADSIEGLATEKRESAENIEQGFGHPTSASEELEEVAQSLDTWAEEVRSADVPTFEDHGCETCGGDYESLECEVCKGAGTCDDGEGSTGTCEECDGQGTVQCPDCEEGVDIDAWREALDEITVVDESAL